MRGPRPINVNTTRSSIGVVKRRRGFAKQNHKKVKTRVIRGPRPLDKICGERCSFKKVITKSKTRVTRGPRPLDEINTKIQKVKTPDANIKSFGVVI